MAKFNIEYTTSTRSCVLLETNDLKLAWRIPQEQFELSLASSSDKVALSRAELLRVLDFFTFAKKEYQAFLKTGPWRTEVLKMCAKLEDFLILLCTEEENTRQLHITVANKKSSLLLTAADIDKMLSSQGKISRIKVDQEYHPGQAPTHQVEDIPLPPSSSSESRESKLGNGSSRPDSNAEARGSSHRTEPYKVNGKFTNGNGKNRKSR